MKGNVCERCDNVCIIFRKIFLQKKKTLRLSDNSWKTQRFNWRDSIDIFTLYCSEMLFYCLSACFPWLTCILLALLLFSWQSLSNPSQKLAKTTLMSKRANTSNFVMCNTNSFHYKLDRPGRWHVAIAVFTKYHTTLKPTCAFSHFESI